MENWATWQRPCLNDFHIDRFWRSRVNHRKFGYPTIAIQEPSETGWTLWWLIFLSRCFDVLIRLDGGDDLLESQNGMPRFYTWTNTPHSAWTLQEDKNSRKCPSLRTAGWRNWRMIQICRTWRQDCDSDDCDKSKMRFRIQQSKELSGFQDFSFSA
jgi:hypothetical protein